MANNQKSYIFIIIMELVSIIMASGDMCYTDHHSTNVAFNKPTFSSSEDKPSVLCVDGIQITSPYKCFKTTVETNPWMLIDLQQETVVNTIILLTRDCEDLRIRLLIGNTFDGMSFNAVTSDFKQCGGVYDKIKTGSSFYIHCYQTLVGRYVVVQMDATNSQLQICEIQIYEEQVFHHEQWTCILPELQGAQGSLNVARGKAAYMSSTAGDTATPDKCVDGDDNPITFGTECHSVKETKPWLVVDLGRRLLVVGVALGNRNNDYSYRLNQFSIYVGNNNRPSTPFDPSKYEVCAKMCHEQINKKRYYSCKSKMDGRHVAVARHISEPELLVIIEVEVYTDAVEDVYFPTLMTGLKWKPPHQNLLFDNDETTCAVAGCDFSVGRPPQSLILHWDPNAKNSRYDEAATYYCQPEFFVNVTVGMDVDVKIFVGNGTLTRGNVSGRVLNYKTCPVIGKTTMQGLIRSKFQCQCTEKCHVNVRIALAREAEDLDDRVCTLKVYD